MSNESIQKVYRFVSWSIIFALILPAFCLVIPELFRFGEINWELVGYVWDHFGTYRYAFPIFLFLYLFLLLLTRKLWVPTLLMPLISSLIGIANYDLLRQRGTPLVPEDFSGIFRAIYALRHGYTVSKPQGIWTVMIVVAVLWFITLFTNVKKDQVRTWIKVISVVLAIATMVGCFFYFTTVLSNNDLLLQLGREEVVDIRKAYEANGFYPELFTQMAKPLIISSIV